MGLKIFQQRDFMGTKLWKERANDLDFTIHDKQSHILYVKHANWTLTHENYPFSPTFSQEKHLQRQSSKDIERVDGTYINLF